jgi:hypothetical protein
VTTTKDIFPSTTTGFLSITSVKQLSEHWDKTQIGELSKDPLMKPFIDDLRRQFNDRWAGVHDRLGVTLEDLRTVPTGEVGIATILPAPEHAVMAIVADITGNDKGAQALMGRISAHMATLGATSSTRQIAGLTLSVYDVPKKVTTDGNEIAAHQTAYFLTQRYFGAVDDLKTAEAMAPRLARASVPVPVTQQLPAKAASAAKPLVPAKPQVAVKPATPVAAAAVARPATPATAAVPPTTLAEVPGFQAVMKRVRADAAGVSQVRWYIQPLRYMETVRANTAERNRRKGRTMIDIFRKVGFTAIQAAGGFVDFASEGVEVIHRTAVYAPGPYEKSMKMMVFPNHPDKDFVPPAWVPRELATCTTFFCDVPNAFDNFDAIFNEMFGEGDSGAFREVIKGLRDDPSGPHVDVRDEIVKYLGPRITVLSDYQLPITTTSERLLYAVETSNEAKVAAGLVKVFKNDPEWRRRVFDGHEIWESVPPEKVEVPSIDLSLPALGPAGNAGANPPAAKPQPLLPNEAITVAHGCLMIASHYDFLTKVLGKVDAEKTLVKASEFQAIEAAIKIFGFDLQSVKSFSRTDEALRPTYELIRQGKMPQSETLLGRIMNSMFGAGRGEKKGVLRKQEIDGAKMPDYEVMRRSLGPSGMAVQSEKEGWFLKGVLLRKDAK